MSKKAFRNALFLENDNPIKKAVIQAIDNRNRAFVNGLKDTLPRYWQMKFIKKLKKRKNRIC